MSPTRSPLSSALPAPSSQSGCPPLPHGTALGRSPTCSGTGQPGAPHGARPACRQHCAAPPPPPGAWHGTEQVLRAARRALRCLLPALRAGVTPCPLPPEGRDALTGPPPAPRPRAHQVEGPLHHFHGRRGLRAHGRRSSLLAAPRAPARLPAPLLPRPRPGGL